MTGSAWIASYVLLYFAALCALAVSLTAARNYGSLTSGGSPTPHSEGLGAGMMFPDLVLVTSDGSEIRPRNWPIAVIVQVSIMDRADIPMFSSLSADLDDQILRRTIICAAGRSEYFAELSDRIGVANLVHDADFSVESALRTQFRPYAVFLNEGMVVAGRPTTSVVDLVEFVMTGHESVAKEGFNRGKGNDVVSSDQQEIAI